MNKPVHRYTYKKKADSLDISRYGLWGDSPPEILFFIVILLIYAAGGMTITRVECLKHTHSPDDFRLPSGKLYLPIASEMAATLSPSATLHAIQFTAVHNSSPNMLGVKYFFTAGESSEIFAVTVRENKDGFSIRAEEYEKLDFIHNMQNDFDFETYSRESERVLNFVLTSEKVLHECYETPHSIILETNGSLGQSQQVSIWNIMFVTFDYAIMKTMVQLSYDSKTSNFEIICNDTRLLPITAKCNPNTSKGDQLAAPGR